jgi:hypothetical protein
MFSARVPESDGRTISAVTVVRIASGEIVRRALIDLQSDSNSRSGQLKITCNGRRGYLLDSSGGALYTYDPRTDAIRLALTGVQDSPSAPTRQR